MNTQGPTDHEDVTSSVEPRRSARSSLTAPLMLLLANRAGLIVLAYMGLTFIHAGQREENAFPGNYFLDGWVRWDAHWYGRIANDGYTNVPRPGSGGERDTNFFPLYPLLARWTGQILGGGNVYVGLLLVANLSFVGAGLILYRLVEERFGAAPARRTLILLSVWPFSYVASAGYTESLFLLLVVATFAFVERRRWLAAALCIGAAGATKLLGIALLIPAAMRFIADWRQQHGPSNRKRLLTGFASLAVALSGLLVWMGFLWIRFGNPFESFAAATAGTWADSNSWRELRAVVHHWLTTDFGHVASGNVPLPAGVQLPFMLLGVALCALAWFKLPPSYAAWATVMTGLSLTRWQGTGRHLFVIFPLFVALALVLRRPWTFHAVVFASTLVLALFTIVFTHGLWID